MSSRVIRWSADAPAQLAPTLLESQRLVLLSLNPLSNLVPDSDYPLSSLRFENDAQRPSARQLRIARRQSLADAETGEERWNKWFFRVGCQILRAPKEMTLGPADAKDCGHLAGVVLEETLCPYRTALSRGE